MHGRNGYTHPLISGTGEVAAAGLLISVSAGVEAAAEAVAPGGAAAGPLTGGFRAAVG